MDDIVTRVDRLVDAEWVVRRRSFLHKAGAQKAVVVKAHAYHGSAYREAAHGLCATELNSRVSWALNKLFETHAAMSASPADVDRRACKDWIAKRIAGEAADLRQHLAPPVEGTASDNLNGDAHRECESAYARIDSEFDKLRRAWTERWSRFLVRSVRGGLMLIGMGSAM